MKDTNAVYCLNPPPLTNGHIGSKGGFAHHGQVPGWGRCSVFLLIVCAPARGGPAARREIR